MKLEEVSVSNFRSITKRTKFDVGDLTTLVGPNNEGKSNLLRAVEIGFQLIQRWSALPDDLAGKDELSGDDARWFLMPSPRAFSRWDDRGLRGYDWARDYPLQKQGSKSAQPTVLRLSFKLTEDEIAKFKKVVGVSSNGTLPLEMQLSRTKVSLGIVKQGPGSATHKARAREIAKFITNGVMFVSIPAVRTSRQAQSLANDLARVRLQRVSQSDEYRQLIAQVNELRRQAVEEIASELTESVKQYLPSVESVRIDTIDASLSDSVADLRVNDGTATSIESKGDGVKSLVSMALLQQLAGERSAEQEIILAVDEPEAHLHSASVHELQRVFLRVSERQQVVLATHNPIFVNRERVSSNIIVRGNDAKPAQSVGQVREAIGVQLHDNLASAETVVLVEGVLDEVILPALLKSVDPGWGDRLASGRVVFKATKGAGKMRSQAQREKSTLCRIISVLDGDETGRQEAKNIIAHEILPVRNVFLYEVRGWKEAEIEDLLLPEIYIPALINKYSRSFPKGGFPDRSVKWSENFKRHVRSVGLAYDDSMLDEAKGVVSETVGEGGHRDLLRPEAAGLIEELGRLLRGRDFEE